MKSDVYFIPVSQKDEPAVIATKLQKLIRQSRILDCLSQGDSTVVKMHFGEEGNTGYVRPEFVRVVVDEIISKGAKPFLSDTNTLYQGRRMKSDEHLRLAYEHGFTKDRVGVDVIIPEDAKDKSVIEVPIKGKFFKSIKVVPLYREAQAIVSLAHFKGHIMTGFGGVLKNIGMGCATREGKLAQHSGVSPFVIARKCTGCEACVTVCPVGAISMKNQKSSINSKACIGCATCIAICPVNAIEVQWEAGGATIQEKMVEYAKGVLQGKENKSAFINVATKITKECDCLAQDDPRIVADIGIFTSNDPVACDKAAFDRINKVAKRDIFKEAHPKRDGLKQLMHAVELGLGNLEYDLVEIN